MTEFRIYYPKRAHLFTDDYGDRWYWNRILSTVEQYHKRGKRAARETPLSENQNNIQGALKVALWLSNGIQLMPGADFHLEAMA